MFKARLSSSEVPALAVERLLDGVAGRKRAIGMRSSLQQRKKELPEALCSR
jgi:hypothetical protein